MKIIKISRHIVRYYLRDTLVIIAACAIILFLLFNYINSKKSLELEIAQARFMAKTETNNLLIDSTLLEQVNSLKQELSKETLENSRIRDSLNRAETENKYLRRRSGIDSLNYVKLGRIFNKNFAKQGQYLDSLDKTLDLYSDKTIDMQEYMKRTSIKDKQELDSIRKHFKGSFEIKDKYFEGTVHIISNDALLRYVYNHEVIPENFRVVDRNGEKRIIGTLKFTNPHARPSTIEINEPYKEYKAKKSGKTVERKTFKLDKNKRIDPHR